MEACNNASYKTDSKEQPNPNHSHSSDQKLMDFISMESRNDIYTQNLNSYESYLLSSFHGEVFFLLLWYSD